jgi:CPA2 family monovalent cation:H+ antiporter-2
VHASVLLLELGLILFSLGVLGRLAARVGVSPIPLYLVAGLAFGEGGLVPLATSEEFIEAGAEIGVVLLLLTLGLEYTADELVGNLREHAWSGLVDLVLNALPGAAVALLLGWGPAPALAMAGVTYISSSGIAAKLLSDLGRLGNRETPAVLSILVLEDLVMALYLPILTGVLAGAGLLGASRRVLLAIAAVGLILLLALRYGHLVSRLVFSASDEVLLLRVLGLALLVAGFADQVGISSAVGAFLVGIAVSGPAADSARAVLTPLRDLFAAVFFVFFGLQTDPTAIPPVLGVALLLGVVTLTTKVATGWWAARQGGIGTLGRFRAGAVLVARGEFSIVIAGLAVAAGVEAAVGPLAATYVLLMAVLGPVAARAAEPAARLGLRVLGREPVRSAAGPSVPAASPAASVPPAAGEPGR